MQNFSTRERLSEIAEVLALGLMRFSARKSSPKSAPDPRKFASHLARREQSSDIDTSEKLG